MRLCTKVPSSSAWHGLRAALHGHRHQVAHQHQLTAVGPRRCAIAIHAAPPPAPAGGAPSASIDIARRSMLSTGAQSPNKQKPLQLACAPCSRAMLFHAAARGAACPAPARVPRAARACRTDARWRRGRLLVAGVDAPPPKPSPPTPPGRPSLPGPLVTILGAWGPSAPEAATRTYSLLCDKLAAAHRVRRALRSVQVAVDSPATPLPTAASSHPGLCSLPMRTAPSPSPAAEVRQVSVGRRTSVCGRARLVGEQGEAGG